MQSICMFTTPPFGFICCISKSEDEPLLTASLTAKPTISSDFERMPANKKTFTRSLETACIDRSSTMEAQRETTKKACVKCMFLQAFCVSENYLCSQMHLLPWLLRAKLCAIIDKYEALILNVYDHVRLAIPIHVLKFNGYLR